MRAWCIVTGSNRRPPACKAEALPTELTMLIEHYHESIANILHMTFFSPYGVKWGIEPSLTVSQTGVQPLH
jgi:hypothetical protein